MSTIFKYPKGSQWRKWDLHIHTPESLVHQYGGNSDEIWERFITGLEALSEEYKVIGINDYLFIDGYRRLLEYKAAGRLQNIELLLPVVEFRLRKFAGTDTHFRRINFHVIFSDTVNPDTIQDQFLNALTSEYQLSPGLDGIEWSGIITKSSLTDLGSSIKQSVPPEELPKFGSDLIEGFNNINLDEDIIFKCLQKPYFKSKYLTAIGKTEWDAMRWNDSSIAEKKDVINKAHLVFISSDSIEHFHNAKRKLSEEGVNDLLLDCSDAHCFSDSQEKDRIGNCFTWIKGDPTFEGLKQILYEPEHRLKISDDIPEVKTQYFVIDKVRFTDESNKLFSNQYIELNPNLNVVIGGKSSGKSIFLYHIAKTIDPPQVTDKLDKALLKGYNFEDYAFFDFEVKWQDGQERAISDTEPPSRTITYIPQLYINKLAEERGEEELQKLIFDILQQNENLKTVYDSEQQTITENRAQISQLVTNYFVEIENFNLETQNLKELGDKLAVSKEIDRIQKLIKELIKKSKLTEEEEKDYEKLNASKKGNEEEIKSFQNQIDEISSLKTIVENLNDSYVTQLDAEITNIEIAKEEGDDIETLKIQILTKIKERILEFFEDIMEKEFSVITEWQDKRSEKDKQIEKLLGELKPYNEKFENRGKIEECQEKLLIEEKLLEEIKQKGKLISSISKRIQGIETEMFDVCQETLKSYVKILNEFSKEEYRNIFGGDMELKTTLEFDNNKFLNKFLSLFDLRANLSNSFYFFDEHNNFQFEPETHTDNIHEVFTSILGQSDPNVRLRHNIEIEESIKKLLDDYLIFKFDILQNGERILEMSPGKRGIVLLYLILHLSHAKHPILIDQPEENLDNRTIYYDLNEYFRQKKLQRQIIIATHNPNLVVSTDAEEVIVANQSGQQKGKDNREHRFEYVSGSLECTSPKNEEEKGILYQMGIREHVCEILEGGKEAFEKREQKYGFK